MHRTLLCAALLATCTAGTAQATTWTYQYQGFYDAIHDTFLPDYIVGGSFTGNDDNGDGSISLEELTQFTESNIELIDNPFCGGEIRCTIDYFRYQLTGQLRYSSNSTYSDEVLFASITTVTGDRHTISVIGPGGSIAQDVRWTDQTTFTISPVPEPSGYAMLGSGALLLAATWWRARRRPERAA